MIDGWIIVTAALVYLSALFLIAWIADRFARRPRSSRRADRGRPGLYALSLAIYCTSWTFFGSVGLATKTGLGFIPVYLGPIVLFAVGWPLLIRIVRLAKSQNTTSIADFLAARYGKSEALAAIVAVFAFLGVLPYIALQLKAVALSLETLIGKGVLTAAVAPGLMWGDIAFSVALLMAIFAVLFGTRHIDATEHQQGLMVAIATESVVKIAAFLFVGAFVTWGIFGGLGDLRASAAAAPKIAALFDRPIPWDNWAATTLISLACIVLLPRQFHVAVVENTSEREVKRAAWLFPIYLVLINLFVVPIAVAGLLKFPDGSVDADSILLSLPLSHGSPVVAMIAFIGGLSAATAMVIMESVALAIMVCNGIVVPLIVRRRNAQSASQAAPRGRDGEAEMGPPLGPTLITIRRIIIFVVLGLAYAFYRTLGQTGGLASIGLLSFAAIAQLAPAFFGGLYWRQATARGAIAGLLTGFVVWCYTLLLPWALKAGWGPLDILRQGPGGFAALRPEALLGLSLDPLAHGVLWSLGANTLAYVVFSLLRAPEQIERLQANIFIRDDQQRGAVPSFRLWRSSVTVKDLMQTAGRFLGQERADRSFEEYARENSVELLPHAEADSRLLKFTELLLASAIGAPSSRLVLSLLLRSRSVGDQTSPQRIDQSSLRLLDDATEALQHNRDLLQSALDQVRHGLAVFDRDMQLICWNRQFRQLLDLPAEFGRVGAPLDRILRHLADRGDLGPGRPEDLVRDRARKLSVTNETHQERRILGGARVLEVRTSVMPQGGFVVTYLDITERVAAAEELKSANETLEARVRERTAALIRSNEALEIARARADEANVDKNRFLAAASHDILQPLNAARLYASALVEQPKAGEDRRLARNIDASLEAVEEILGALIEIARLDSGRMVPELAVVPVNDLFEQMQLEFAPAAREKGLRLRVVPTSAFVRSDRRLLRRILQNLVSNAIKYTASGTVLIGCRRRDDAIVLQVSDSGPGIPADKQTAVFKEFERLPETASAVRGLGLGLSIVERICHVLDHPVALVSTYGRGSTFTVALPASRPPVTGAARPAESPVLGLPIAHITALCIDNEPAILDAMCTLIEGWGARVLIAASKEAAAAVLRETRQRPDIILADYHLAEGTGLEAIAHVRAQLGVTVPAVIITADHSAQVQREVRDAGIPMLRKPLKAAPLRAVLAQAAPPLRSAAE